MNGGDGAFERSTPDRLAVVPATATSYTLEKVDDRGPTSLTFGLNDDCTASRPRCRLCNQLIRYNAVLAANGRRTEHCRSMLLTGGRG